MILKMSKMIKKGEPNEIGQPYELHTKYIDNITEVYTTDTVINYILKDKPLELQPHIEKKEWERIYLMNDKGQTTESLI